MRSRVLTPRFADMRRTSSNCGFLDVYGPTPIQRIHQADLMYLPVVMSSRRSPPFVQLVVHPLRWRLLSELARSRVGVALQPR
jgi:hypothetical protein